MLFGAIADDFTGGSDLAGMLFEQGVRTALLFGAGKTDLAAYDAAVLCLKTRSAPVEEARATTREALCCLMEHNPRQVQFKYCSTFDSTPEGNIGPVIDELMTGLGVNYTVAVPALPVNGRTQYLGHLFVNGVLLSESPLRTHPLNPMTDSNLVRWLQRQTRRNVGLITLDQVRRGALVASAGVEIALVDATCQEDLHEIASAVVDLKLITGGSGLGMALPEVWRRRGLLDHRGALDAVVALNRRALVLAGSCSTATLGQLEDLAARGVPLIQMNVAGLSAAEVSRLETAAMKDLEHSGVAVIYSSAKPEDRVPGAAASIEQSFAELARRLTRAVGTLVVAGGETAGAVVEALGIRAVEVTGIIDPGVPRLRTTGGVPLRLALKSGNFGSGDFFSKAIQHD